MILIIYYQSSICQLFLLKKLKSNIIFFI